MGRKYHCIVPCCDSYLDKGIFHFPKNDSLKKLWIEALKLNSVGPSALVCIKHFREKYDYCKVSYGTGFRYKLSEDAIPNLCLPEKSHESGEINQEITHVYIKKEVENDAFEKIPEVPLKVKIKTEENVVKFPPEEAFPVYMNG